MTGRKLAEMSAGNIGAANFLMQVAAEGREFVLDKIYELKITGTDLYVLFSDLGNRDIDTVEKILEKVPTAILVLACSKQDYSGQGMIAPYLNSPAVMETHDAVADEQAFIDHHMEFDAEFAREVAREEALEKEYWENEGKDFIAPGSEVVPEQCPECKGRSTNIKMQYDDVPCRTCHKYVSAANYIKKSPETDWSKSDDPRVKELQQEFDELRPKK